MWVKVLKWFIFSVLLSVLALALAAVLAWLRDQPIALGMLIGHGQLLPICASISGKAMIDSFTSPLPRLDAKIAVGGFAFLSWGASTVLLTLLSSAEDGNPEKVAMLSILLFAFAVVLGVLGVALDSAEVQDEQ